MKHTWTYIIKRRHHHVVESYQLGTILSTTDTKRPDHTKVNVVFERCFKETSASVNFIQAFSESSLPGRWTAFRHRFAIQIWL